MTLEPNIEAARPLHVAVARAEAAGVQGLALRRASTRLAAVSELAAAAEREAEAVAWMVSAAAEDDDTKPCNDERQAKQVTRASESLASTVLTGIPPSSIHTHPYANPFGRNPADQAKGGLEARTRGEEGRGTPTHAREFSF